MLKRLLLGAGCLAFGVYGISFAAQPAALKKAYLKGEYRQAISVGTGMLNSGQTKDFEVRYILGLSYLKESDFSAAQDNFRAAIDNASGIAQKEKAMLGLGDSYLLRNDFEAAQVQYQQILTANPATSLRQELGERINKVSERIAAVPLFCTLKPEAGFLTVQVGIFANKANAEKLAEKLLNSGFPARVEEDTLSGAPAYRVRVGQCISEQEVKELENKLFRSGYPTKICQ